MQLRLRISQTCERREYVKRVEQSKPDGKNTLPLRFRHRHQSQASLQKDESPRLYKIPYVLGRCEQLVERHQLNTESATITDVEEALQIPLPCSKSQIFTVPSTEPAAISSSRLSKEILHRGAVCPERFCSYAERKTSGKNREQELFYRGE